MRHCVGRRSFLKTAGLATASLALGGLGNRRAWAGKRGLNGAAHAERLGWLLGCHAYTFRRFSFFEAIEKTASLGLGYVEAYPGQRLGKEKAVRMGIGLSQDLRQQIKTRLDDVGVKMVNYGVCRLTKDEAESRKTFDFAKDMGVETLVAEPPEDAFDALDKLCDEYQINLAIHNHPKPSIYWDYRKVLAVCKGRSKRIGACCDTGHWMRSGIRPLEAIKALQGRIISFHLKDLNAFGERRAHDVPWGTGKGDIQQVLQELYRQKFRGVFAIEYERATANLLANMAHCVGYFDGVAAELPGNTSYPYDPPRTES